MHRHPKSGFASIAGLDGIIPHRGSEGKAGFSIDALAEEVT